MKDYFTISEFASLRNININSLRYYEKMGLLVPAHVDPQTRYRYYSARQLVEKEYQTTSGTIEIRRLLEDGKRAAEKKAAEVAITLEHIEYALTQMDSLKQYRNRTGHYTRTLEERRLVLSAPFEHTMDIREIEKHAKALHQYARNRDLFPVLPAGMIIRYENEGNPSEQCMFFEIINRDASGENILTLPEGEYACVQTSVTAERDIRDLIAEAYGPQSHTQIIVANMMLEKLSFKEKLAELQKKL